MKVLQGLLCMCISVSGVIGNSAVASSGDTQSGGATMSETIQITMAVDNTIITAELDNSQTKKEFLVTLPRTMTMRRYGDREYYGKVGHAISEEGQHIDDYLNGDVTYYAAGRSFAIFFDKENQSSQSGLIRMGKITSDLHDFDDLADSVEMRIEAAQ